MPLNKLAVLSSLKLTTLNADMHLKQIILYMAEAKILTTLIIQRVDQQGFDYFYIFLG